MKSNPQISLLYKLIDDHPDSARDTPESHQQLLSNFYKNIHHDLENLLNTKTSGIFYQEGNQTLNSAIINYGLRDLFNHPLLSHYKNDFMTILKNTIENFEPRLKKPEVHILQNEDPSERTLRFRIIGSLHLASEKTLITLDSKINLENYSLQISPLQDY